MTFFVATTAFITMRSRTRWMSYDAVDGRP